MVHSTENQSTFPKVTESTTRRPSTVADADVVFEVTTEYEDGRRGALRILAHALVQQKEDQTETPN